MLGPQTVSMADSQDQMNRLRVSSRTLRFGTTQLTVEVGDGKEALLPEDRCLRLPGFDWRVTPRLITLNRV